MYSKFDGTQIAESSPSNGVQSWTDLTGATISGTDLNDTISGQGNDVLVGMAGDDNYYLSGSGDLVVENPGSGIDTVTAWSSYTLPDNVENLNVSGSDYLYAAGNALDNLIKVGDSNQMTLYGAGGDNVLVGGAGADTFVIDGTAGSNAIYGWHAGDTLRLMGSDLRTFADVQAAMVQQGSDVVFQSGQNHVLIRDTTVAQFSAADFYLGLDPSKLGAATFDDEFNALSLHTAANPVGTWTTNYGYGGIGSYTLTGNGELQIYAAPGFTGTTTSDLGLNPFSISDGVLDIRAQTVDAATSADIWGYGYTSGAITTKQSFSQTYGYFEMRADLPEGVSGAWPAFWLVPADGSWPPELDVMETLSGQPNIDYTTAHSAASGSHTAVGAANLVTSEPGYHTYGVLWTATTLTWYLDGEAVFQTATPADMNQPMYMIANMAVGGWAGTPDFTSADMKIDYIRAYALADGSSSWTTIVNPDPASSTLATSTDGSGSTGAVITYSGSGSGVVTGVTVTDAVYAAPDGVTTITLAGAGQTITGNGSGDTFISNNAGNHLTGGAGADTFVIGRGGDVVTGGAGADTFLFKETPWAPGHITDFTGGQDHIDLTGLLAKSGYAGSNAIADGYIKIVADGAGAQIWSNLEPLGGGLGWWLATTLDGVDAASLQMQGGVITGAAPPPPPPPPPAAPTGLADAAVFNGFVNRAGDTPTQTLTGTAAAGATVTVYDGTSAMGSAPADTAGAWSFNLGVLADGAHSLSAVASTAAGQSGASAPLAFTVDTQAAAPAALADAQIVNGYVNKAGDVAAQTLTGSAEAGAMVSVYDQGWLIGSATADALTGQWAYALGQLADGAHALTATAADLAGNLSQSSAALNFVVDTQAPAPVVSDVLASGTGQTTIRGSAEAGSAVSVYDGGKLLGTATAGSTGAWSLGVALSGSGVHSLTQTATDAAGNGGSAPGVTLYSAQANQSLVGGAGADVLIGRGGDTLTGGAGSDHFVFNPAFGKETILDFKPGTATAAGDQVHFDHTFVPDFAHVIADAKQVGADVVITVDRSDVLTLHNVNLSALHASDFVFF
jgi:beta-glucanase (GH16 family)